MEGQALIDFEQSIHDLVAEIYQATVDLMDSTSDEQAEERRDAFLRLRDQLDAIRTSCSNERERAVYDRVMNGRAFD